MSLLLINNVYGQSKTLDLTEIDRLHKEEMKTKLDVIVDKVDKAIYEIIKLPDLERKRFATIITLSCKKYDIDPRIMISLIKVESDFKQKAISHTGDYSVAQINYKVWVKRFKQLDRTPLHYEKLKEDDVYAIFRMGEILAELKKDFSKKDKMWFARYHSSTPYFKEKYISRLKPLFKKLIPFGPNLLKDLPEYQKIAFMEPIH